MKHFALLILLLISASFSFADGKVSLEMKAMEEVEIVKEDGQKEIKLIKPASVTPGDIVLYTIEYHNQGAEPAESVVITNPIPEHMLFVTESGHGSDTHITFSVDGGKTYNTSDKLTVINEDGSQRPATREDYTHIKWELNEPLNPDARGIVGYRSRLK